MTYKEGEAVLYKPLNVIAYIRRVNNRPEVSETQRCYHVDVNGYLVIVSVYLESQYLAPAPPKPRPPVRKPGIFDGLKLPKWFGGKQETSTNPKI